MPASVDQGDRPSYPIGSVDSALKLLRMVSEHERVRISDASKELGVARSTAHRIMQMLYYHGFVKQDPESKAYTAGPVLIGMGLQVIRKLDVRAVARPHMEALVAELQETVMLLARQTDTEVVCLDSVESPRALRVGGRTGVVLTAHTSASGRALLSTIPDAEVRALYPHARLTNLRPTSIKTRAALLEELALTRERGFALQRDETEDDVSAVSAPIGGSEGRASFALTITIPTARMTDALAAQIGEAVMSEAREMATALPF